MNNRLIIEGPNVTREVDIGNGIVNKDERDTLSFAEQLAKRAPIQTGILPPGVMSIRQAGDYLQLVMQTPPKIQYIHWTEYQGDGKEKLYTLAQPYRVIVGEFINGDLLGARMFYSPTPVVSLEQPLYHQNVPNINCKGYKQTAVGWVCLYHDDAMKDLTIAQKAARIMERCSGVEIYNDGNMSETDGPRFYAEKKKPDFTSDPAKWEEKTEKEGIEWTLDPDLWIPITVAGPDSQLAHHPGGVPLTLGMVMHGNGPGYYGDMYLPKLINAIVRDDQKPKPEDVFTKIFTQAFIEAGVAKVAPKVKVAQPKKPVAKKLVAAKIAKPKEGVAVPQQGGKWFEAQPYVPPAPKVVNCKKCKKEFKLDIYGYNKEYCADCLLLRCNFCAKFDGHLMANGCSNCLEDWGQCFACQEYIGGPDIHRIYIPAQDAERILCDVHFEMSRICSACQNLWHEDDCQYTNEGAILCANCGDNCDDCGRLFVGGHAHKCPDCIGQLAQAG